MNALGAKLRRGGGFGGDVGLAEATTLCVVVFHSEFSLGNCITVTC